MCGSNKTEPNCLTRFLAAWTASVATTWTMRILRSCGWSCGPLHKLLMSPLGRTLRGWSNFIFEILLITSQRFVTAPSISGRKAGPYRWRTNETSVALFFVLRGRPAETFSINRPFLGFAAINPFHCSGKCSAHPSLS